MVDGFVHDGSGDRCYTLQQDKRIAVPDKFHVVLDMSNGTLSFIVDGKWLGTALNGTAGHCLYPIVTSRLGNCRMWRYLRCLLQTSTACKSPDLKKLHFVLSVYRQDVSKDVSHNLVASSASSLFSHLLVICDKEQP
ncbi:SPRY domain-containing SOCS box protein 1 [Homalodisca vitripennis]|nr:SPRY domain-containing SOCS box protein 1 [Homalodisca vitripennis]